jgi:hypothetical protein
VDLQVVGAGLGRTGTMSLKRALEQLLDAPCYHMHEVWLHDGHDELWRRAALGDTGVLDSVLAGYTATLDWPACAFWPELTTACPDSIVLLSERESAEEWWRSADRTIFEATRRGFLSPTHRAMWDEVTRTRFTDRWGEPGPAMHAYERHNAEVRASVPAERLLEWRPSDGWGPICRRLGLPEPAEPFPHVNRGDEFRARNRFDADESERDTP